MNYILTAFHESSVRKYEYELRKDTEESSSYQQHTRLMHMYMLWCNIFRQN